jgi:hypothetical protein
MRMRDQGAFVEDLRLDAGTLSIAVVGSGLRGSVNLLAATQAVRTKK